MNTRPPGARRGGVIMVLTAGVCLSSAGVLQLASTLVATEPITRLPSVP